jgi:hypothetical protein
VASKSRTIASILGIATVLAGQIPLADQGCQKHVLPQLIVIIQILVAQSQSVNALSDQFLNRVLGQDRRPVIHEAGGELAEDARPLLDLPQQQPPSIGGDPPSVKSSGNFSPREGLKFQRTFVTLCNHRAASLLWT